MMTTKVHVVFRVVPTDDGYGYPSIHSVHTTELGAEAARDALDARRKAARANSDACEELFKKLCTEAGIERFGLQTPQHNELRAAAEAEIPPSKDKMMAFDYSPVVECHELLS